MHGAPSSHRIAGAATTRATSNVRRRIPGSPLSASQTQVIGRLKWYRRRQRHLHLIQLRWQALLNAGNPHRPFGFVPANAFNVRFPIRQKAIIDHARVVILLALAVSQATSAVRADLFGISVSLLGIGYRAPVLTHGSPTPRVRWGPALHRRTPKRPKGPQGPAWSRVGFQLCATSPESRASTCPMNG
jgi:hypothetical protein